MQVVMKLPEGSELCCLLRENTHKERSLVMFSRDEGRSWSTPINTSWGLTGDRHAGVFTKDGRMVVAFRYQALNSPTKGHFVAWVGTYDDIKECKPGRYRVSLLKTFKDGFYPGLHLLPDGIIVATTYANYRKEDVGCSIVSVRFTMSEVDEMAKALK